MCSISHGPLSQLHRIVSPISRIFEESVKLISITCIHSGSQTLVGT